MRMLAAFEDSIRASFSDDPGTGVSQCDSASETAQILTISRPKPHANKRPIPLFSLLLQRLLPLLPLQRLQRTLRQGQLMTDRLLPTTPLSYKTRRGSKDTPAPLPRLYGAGREALPFPHALNVVEDRDGGVAGEDEIAVHAVDDKVARYGVLCGSEGLRNHGAAIYASRSGWVPQRSSVGVDVLNGEGRSAGRFHKGLQETREALETHRANVYESCEVEDILDWGLARVDGWRLDEGGSRHTGG